MTNATPLYIYLSIYFFVSSPIYISINQSISSIPSFLILSFFFSYNYYRHPFFSSPRLYIYLSIHFFSPLLLYSFIFFPITVFTNYQTILPHFLSSPPYTVRIYNYLWHYYKNYSYYYYYYYYYYLHSPFTMIKKMRLLTFDTSIKTTPKTWYYYFYYYLHSPSQW